jgi:hypothetical protein
MKDIKVISGMLKVSRSFALVSLYFLKSLERIDGLLDTGEDFALTILENENLQKLFPDNARVKIRGRAFVHYNQKLCMEEINSLIEASGMSPPMNFDVSEVTNGNKAGLATKNPPKKPTPKKPPKKTHLKWFFCVFLNLNLFMKIIQTYFSL